MVDGTTGKCISALSVLSFVWPHPDRHVIWTQLNQRKTNGWIWSTLWWWNLLNVNFSFHMFQSFFRFLHVWIKIGPFKVQYILTTFWTEVLWLKCGIFYILESTPPHTLNVNVALYYTARKEKRERILCWSPCLLTSCRVTAYSERFLRPSRNMVTTSAMSAALIAFSTKSPFKVRRPRDWPKAFASLEKGREEEKECGGWGRR